MTKIPMTNVAVLGCGPAGLMAAHAAAQAGAEVSIFSHKVLSPLGGAQYLHSTIPGVTSQEPQGWLSYVKLGDAAGYAYKVYGSPDAPTSWENFQTGEHPAWSLRLAYRKLAELYLDQVVHGIIDDVQIAMFCQDYDLVLCTIPAKLLCQADHNFNGQEVVLARDALEDVNNVVMYSGRPDDSWYRKSQIFGHGWTEWTRALAPDELLLYNPAVVRGIKPLDTNCNCHQHHRNFVRLGRFGQWKKAVLTSDAYKDARLIVDEMPVRS